MHQKLRLSAQVLEYVLKVGECDAEVSVPEGRRTAGLYPRDVRHGVTMLVNRGVTRRIRDTAPRLTPEATAASWYGLAKVGEIERGVIAELLNDA